jgi:hypothetical protein
MRHADIPAQSVPRGKMRRIAINYKTVFDRTGKWKVESHQKRIDKDASEQTDNPRKPASRIQRIMFGRHVGELAMNGPWTI